MTLIPNRLKSYLKETNTLLYSYIIVAPLFIGYELLIFISQPTTEQIVRIAVDVWLKNLFSYIGINTLSFLLILLILAGIFILYRERERFAQLKTKYLAFILVESCLYAMLVAFLASFFTTIISGLNAFQSGLDELSYLQKFSLSLGAGLYEEIFYRVILYTVFYKLATRFMKFQQYNWLINNIIAITLSSLLFSIAHYTGELGDIFTVSSFTFRFIFSVLLTVIYINRGFGVTAWTHAIYDLIVITLY